MAIVERIPRFSDKESSLTSQEIRDLGNELHDPVETFTTNEGVSVSVYRGKQVGCNEWESEATRKLAKEARRSYERYGNGFGEFDKFEEKAGHYLTRVEYQVESPEGNIPVVEWHSLRFIPPTGEPISTEDLDFYIVGPNKEKPFDVMYRELYVNGNTPDKSAITQSRLCVIRPQARDEDSEDFLKQLNLRNKFTALGFATNTKAVIDDIKNSGIDIEGMWMTSQMWPSLHQKVVGFPEINGTLPFKPAHEVLNLQKDEVYLDRKTAYAHEVPAYFLKWKELMEVLKRFDSKNPNVIPEDLLTLTDTKRFSLKDLDTNQELKDKAIKLGEILIQDNEQVAQLRDIIDKEVSDQPTLYLGNLAELQQGCSYLIEQVKNRKDLPAALNRDFLINPEAANKKDRTQFPYKPVIFDAESALKYGQVVVNKNEDGLLESVTIYNPEISEEPLTIPASNIEASIKSSYDSLYRVVNTAIQKYGDQNLPEDNKLGAESFGAFVENEYQLFYEKLFKAETEEQPFVPHGSFVFDPLDRKLRHFAPQNIYELSLLTSQTLYDDTENRSTYEIWELLASNTIGIFGTSIGGSIAEGYTRAVPGGKLLLVEMDFMEPGNLPRAARGDAEDLTHPFSVKETLSHFEEYPKNKAFSLARKLMLFNPYLDIEIYPEGVSENNVEEIFQKLDLGFDEIDNPILKIELLRMVAKKMQVPMMMASDIDDRVAFETHEYHKENTPTLNGYTETETQEMLSKLKSGSRKAFTDVFEAIVGSEYHLGDFAAFLHDNSRKYLTGSLPQHGDTSMGAGYLGAKMAVGLLLGHKLPSRYWLTPGYGEHYQAEQSKKQSTRIQPLRKKLRQQSLKLRTR